MGSELVDERVVRAMRFLVCMVVASDGVGREVGAVWGVTEDIGIGVRLGWLIREAGGS